MKNWDPLSLFKYLTGSPNIHIAFVILLSLHASSMDELPDRIRPLCIGEPGKSEKIFESKIRLVRLMIWSHAICFFMQIFVESGFV